MYAILMSGNCRIWCDCNLGRSSSFVVWSFCTRAESEFKWKMTLWRILIMLVHVLFFTIQTVQENEWKANKNTYGWVQGWGYIRGLLELSNSTEAGK